jgi:hypothetical protein
MSLPTSVIGGKADDNGPRQAMLGLAMKVVPNTGGSSGPITNPWGPGVTMNFNLENALVLPSVFLNQENWFDTGRFKALPAVSEWPDFDDCHGSLCVSPRSANMFI